MTARLLLVTASLAVFVPSSLAYQTDVHYGLTYWLARSTGFEVWQSHEIARENEKADVGDLDAVHAMASRVCGGFDEAAAENAAQTVRDLHFRSSGTVPAPAAKRLVKPDPDPKGFTSRDVEALLVLDALSFKERLGRMGRALHGWQDAFSHAGVPDERSPCALRRPELSWSHPRDRGGWWRSKADLTFEDPASCINAGLSSFDYLVRLRDLLKVAGPTLPRGKVRDGLVVFCGARTKAAKARWFLDNGVPQAAAIVAKTSLEDGEGGRRLRAELNLLGIAGGQEIPSVDRPYYDLPVAQRADDRPVIPPALATMPSSVVLQGSSETQFVRSFLLEWLSAGPANLNAVSVKYFDGAVPPPPGGWMNPLFRWKVIDRGRAESTAALDPSEPIVRDDSLEKLLVPVRGQPKQPFLVLREPNKKDEFLALFILRHAPYQTILLRVRATKDGFRVIAFDGITLT